MAGKDATDAFVQYHPNEVYKLLTRFHVANVVSKDVKESAFVKEHRAIRQKLLEEGKFKTDYSFYLWLAFLLTIMFSISLYLTLGSMAIGLTSLELLGLDASGSSWPSSGTTWVTTASRISRQ